jgi:hypothetical protein
MKKFQLLIVFVILSMQINAQSNWELFKKQSGPLKKWALLHPFKVKKAYLLSTEVKKLSDSIANTNLLDKDKVGGQVDAFRHAYWMAILHQEIGRNAARSLGRAYERANYKTFKKSGFEEGLRPDFASKKMDLFNNKVGLKLSFKGDSRSKEGLVYKVVNIIKKGDLKIIKKDNFGNYLNCRGEIILPETLTSWKNNKCLISSK